MIIKRDFLETLLRSSVLEVVMLWGPRQVGKTTLLDQLDLKSRLFMDDATTRSRARDDPTFVLENASLPCLIDEIQYAPELFPEIKLRVDLLRRNHLKKGSPTSKTLYYLTGSNRTLLDKNVKESLAGRSHLYFLHGLSIRELLTAFPRLSISEILLRGGLPETYTRPELVLQKFLNDYILSFIEKDVAQSAGVEKMGEFQTVLRLLAARTGQFLNVTELSGAAGVDQKTVQNWIQILERNAIIETLAPFHSNLTKRITKMKKLYFYDTGICSRLQGHANETLLWNSPHSGSLFETLVFSELVKTRDNFLKDWQLHTWRTKEQNEIDFILRTERKTLFIEAKLGIHGAQPFELDREARKVFDPPFHKLIVTSGGEEIELNRDTTRVPISRLTDYLFKINS